MAASPQTNGQKTIPTLWRERILKRDFEIVLGKMLQSDQGREDETEESYLRSANVQWEGLDLSDVKTMWFSSSEKRDLLLRKGDLVVNEGGDVGRCAIWRGIPESFYFQNAINRVRARTSASTRFLYYWLYNLKHAGFIDAMVSRITIAHLTAEKLARVPWPNVPSAEQQRIATYLDASCAAIDAAVAAKRRQLETLDAINKAIITKAVTTGITASVALRSSGVEWIGDIPRHWKVEKLKYLTSLIVDGTHITPTYLPDGVPFLRVTDVQDHTIDLGNVKYISPEEHQLLSKRAKAKRGDILLSKNGTIGLVKIVNWDWEFSFFVSLCLLRPHKKLNPHYFSYFFESSLVDQQLSESSKKTSVTNLHLVKIRELLISLPPPDEQSKIVQHLQSKCAEVQSLKGNITNQIATLTAYRKSLIHECVTGQRRITGNDTSNLMLT